MILDCGDIYECDVKIQSTEDSQADISKIIFFGFSTEFYILHVIYSSVQKILPEFNFLLAVAKKNLCDGGVYKPRGQNFEQF